MPNSGLHFYNMGDSSVFTTNMCEEVNLSLMNHTMRSVFLLRHVDVVTGGSACSVSSFLGLDGDSLKKRSISGHFRVMQITNNCSLLEVYYFKVIYF